VIQNRRWIFGIVILVYLCIVGGIFGILGVINSMNSTEIIPEKPTDLEMTVNVLITRALEATIPISITLSPTISEIELTPELELLTPSPIPSFWPTYTATHFPTFTPTPTFEISSLVPEICTCRISAELYCGSFKNQTEAQACYIHCGGVNRDIYQLDKNENGIACGQWKYPEP